MTPGGNRSVGRSRSRSRQVGGSATSTSMPMFIVVPMDSTSSATSGVLAIGRFLSSEAKTRKAVIVTTLPMTGASVGPVNFRYACSTPVSTTDTP